MRIRAYALALSTFTTLTLVACGTQVAGVASTGGAVVPNTSVGQTSGELPTGDASVPTGELPTELTIPTDLSAIPTDITIPTDFTVPTDIDFPTDLTDISIPTDFSIPELPTDVTFPTDFTMPTDIAIPTSFNEDCLTVSAAIAGISGMGGLPVSGDIDAAIAAAPELAGDLEIVGNALKGVDVNDQSALMSLMSDPAVLASFEKVGAWLTANCS